MGTSSTNGLRDISKDEADKLKNHVAPEKKTTVPKKGMNIIIIVTRTISWFQLQQLLDKELDSTTRRCAPR